MKKSIGVIFFIILICVVVITGIVYLLNKRNLILDYDKVVAVYPQNRMLEFDETYYFNGKERTEEDMVTGTVWRVDYNGHVTAFKFLNGSEYFDYVDFYISSDETKKIWEYADSLEGNYVPDGYDGYVYGSVLYKYTKDGKLAMQKFLGLSSDYPLADEIYEILSDKYDTALKER